VLPSSRETMGAGIALAKARGRRRKTVRAKVVGCMVAGLNWFGCEVRCLLMGERDMGNSEAYL
jgi:hypothetical protein